MSGTSKGHLVNWTYLPRTGKQARTLEFRQLEGTGDIGDVRGWVGFLVSLVRECERRGRVWGEGYEGQGCRYREWNEGIGIWDLLEEIGLGVEGRRWVERRVGMWG